MNPVLLTTACLVLASFAGVASATHVCNERELVFTSGVGAHGCAGTGQMTYTFGSGTLVGSQCTPVVPEVRVLGERVPGTGQAHCTPPVGLDPTPVTTPWAGACLTTTASAPYPGCWGPCQQAPPVFTCEWNRQTTLP